MAQQIPSLLHKKTVVQDSGLLMSFAYANSRASQGYMNTQESTLYNEIAMSMIKNIPEETLIIYLDLPVSTLRKRIEERQRTFEIRFHSEDYLQHLDQSIKEIISAQQTKGVKILQYTEDNWCDIVRKRDDQKRLIQDVQTMVGEKGVV
jgi:deoxyadenosine/deoxycytidine kinase